MAELRDYSFGRLLVDGEVHRRDVIVLPERVVGEWWRRDGHSLVIEDLEEVIDELPDALIVGCGHDGRLKPHPSVLEALRDRGVYVEVLRTGEAVKRYAESDPERTAAALHLTC